MQSKERDTSSLQRKSLHTERESDTGDFLRTYMPGTMLGTRANKDEHSLVLALKETVFQLSMLISFSSTFSAIEKHYSKTRLKNKTKQKTQNN